ncbi:MAG: MFS transporter [Bacteroidetes bacterium]|jgi:MFS family permease|nr:MFS transporter [Bacteroidota bacterium]
MDPATRRRNFRVHLVEGALYIGSGAFIAGPTVVPAIVLHLGGSTTHIGALPVIIYFAFYAPQLFSALHARTFTALKPWVLRGGMIQRLHILAMAAVLALAASGVDGWPLTLFLLLLALNQLWAGLVSPLWFDFFTRTTSVHERGRLLGWRSAGGACLSFLNSFVLTAALALFGFSWGIAAAIAVAFAFQASSWMVQRKVVESEFATLPAEAGRHRGSDIIRILRTDRRMRRFLLASGFVTSGASAGVFILPAATAKFGSDPASVGIYTMVLVAAQMFGGGWLGWLTDRRGSNLPLIICAISSALALGIATLADTPGMMVAAFIALGIPLGAEMMARYSFAAEASSAGERALYIGLMNVCLAPWQALSVAAGFGVDRWGYPTVFVSAIVSILIGVILLRRVPAIAVA